MGLMETLFGPDGIGGEPGLVGKAGNAVWQGTGELDPQAGLGETVVKSLGNIPHLLTDIAIKNPLEILKDPASVLNDQGQISFTRLLFPDFRRNVVKAEQQQAEAQKAYTAVAGLNANKMILDSIFNAAGVQGPEGVEQAVAMGADRAAAERRAVEDQTTEDQTLAARDAVAGIAPGVPRALLDTGITEPGQGLETYLNIERSNAMASERSQDNARADRQFSLSQAAADRAATAAERAAMEPWEKALQSYRQAVASKDPLAIEAARAAMKKLEGSSGPVTVVRTPDGGEVISGDGRGVAAFGSQTAKDRAAATVDAQDALLNTIGEMRTLADKNPEAFGAAGAVGGFAQNVTEQGKAFAALRQRVSDDIAKGGAEPEVGAAVAESFVNASKFNEAIPQRIALENTLAYAKARANNPDGKISDADYKAALATVRGGQGEGADWMANAASTKAVLDVLERDAKRERARAKLRAGKPGKEKSALAQEMDKAEGKGQAKPSLRDRKKGQTTTTKAPSEMTDDEIQMELLKLEGR